VGEDVSVVIPTTLRDPALLTRAVDSAARQVPPPREIIVVVDRPDVPELPELTVDVAVSVIRNEGTSGPSGARNTGFRAARGAFVALLDDDDYWLDGKLEIQLQATAALPEAARGAVVVATCGYLLDEDLLTRAPLRLPEPGQNLVRYLYEPSTIRRPDRQIYTPSLVVTRELALAHPFDETLRNWEDIEWLLRMTDAGGTLLYCSDPLIVCDHRTQSGRPSLSQLSKADGDAEWARRFLRPRSEHAFHNFRLTHVARRLMDEGRRRDALRIGVASLRTGTWHLDSALEFAAFVALSVSQRSRLRRVRRRLGHVKAKVS